MAKLWSKDEIDYLKQSREDSLSYKDIAKYLNRSLQSVQRKAQRLNIVKKEWTKEEIQILKNSVENKKPIKNLVPILNRSLQAIYRKASNLNLKYDYVGKYSERLPEYIVALEKYKGANIKIKHKDIRCNHIWLATPHSILEFHGCPKCKGCGGAFENTKEAYLYVIEFSFVPNIYKIGITNNIKRRIRELGEHANPIYYRYFEQGIEAKKLEKQYLNNVKDLLINTGKLTSGNTETFYYE